MNENEAWVTIAAEVYARMLDKRDWYGAVIKDESQACSMLQQAASAAADDFVSMCRDADKLTR